MDHISIEIELGDTRTESADKVTELILGIRWFFPRRKYYIVAVRKNFSQDVKIIFNSCCSIQRVKNLNSFFRILLKKILSAITSNLLSLTKTIHFHGGRFHRLLTPFHCDNDTDLLFSTSIMSELKFDVVYSSEKNL